MAVMRGDPDERRECVGYWRSSYDDAPARLPDPRELVDPHWPLRERARVAAYLRRGRTDVAYMGYSHCRFDCGIPVQLMGTRDLADDRYIWPEGLHHYVEVHAVRLPAAFLEHVDQRRPRAWPGWRVGVWWRALVVAYARARQQAAERARALRSKREALHEAAKSGDVDAVRRLLESGRQVDARDEYGMTALALARSFEVAQVLIEAGARVDPQPPGHITPLQQAVVAKHEAWIRYLLERGANLHALDKFERSVLSYCGPELLPMLLAAGADVRLGDPVCNAAQHGDVAMIATLLDAGAAIEGSGKTSPLLLAARGVNGDAVLAYLLERGADVTRTDDGGHSTLMHAAARNSLFAVRLLLEHGAARVTTPPRQVRGRVNALHMSAIGNKGSEHAPDVLKLLLEQPQLRAQIDARDEWGRTPLCCAATYGDAERVRVLLEAGADATIANKDGYTPLMIARGRALADMQALLER